VRLFACISMQALLDFEIIRVKLLFFPTVTKRAPILKGTAIFIRCYKVFSMPIFAHILSVTEYRRLSTIILPVMSIHAHIAFMVIFSVGTPYSFEMKNIEVHIRLKFFNKFHREFSVMVRKRAELSIFAFSHSIQIG
jgi:hypothetical protein